MRKLVLIILMACSILMPTGLLAAELNIISIQGLTKTSSNSFRIAGNDPHLVLPLAPKSGGDVTAQLSGDQSLILPMSLRGIPKSQLEIPVEVFFKSTLNSNSRLFDPIYRIQFIVDRAEFSSIRIPIPKDLNFDSLIIRVDIDQCNNCQILLSGSPYLSTDSSETFTENSANISNFRLMNGARSIPNEGLDVAVDNWELHHLKSSTDGLLVSGEDPFLISPIIDASIDELAGVLFELDAPGAETPVFDFQLFYATESHKFIEPASSIMRVAGQANTQKSTLRFYIPLGFLSSQNPKVQLFKQLRLDLATRSLGFDQSVHSSYWRLLKVSLVNKDSAAPFTSIRPAQLVHSKMQKATTAQVIKGIFHKVTADKGFIFSYVLLLMTVIIIAYRRFRAARAT